MRLTDFDVLAFAVGGVAVVFSGFVLAHSVVGGLALLAAAVVSASIPLFRDRTGTIAAVAAAWLLVGLLVAGGVGGFLVGFGAFDEPDVRWESNATRYDAPEDRSTVVVTGTVTNDGDAAATDPTVTATLVDANGTELHSESKQLPAVAPDATQQFYFTFESSDGRLERFDDADVDVEVAETGSLRMPFG